jgi:hypothetical protein
MKHRLDEAAAERLERFYKDLPDYLGKALDWLSDQAIESGKKQARDVFAGTTTLAAIHAKIVGAFVVAGGLAAAIATAIWSLGAQVSHTSSAHLIPYVVLGGPAAAFARSSRDAVRGAWQGPKQALMYLDRTLSPVEATFFRQLGSSPPQRVVLKISGKIEAALLSIFATAVAVVFGIFVLGAIFAL